MSEYTTGEAAKLCGVTVRTMQYYDRCGLLSPSRLTEGGRRLYSNQDIDTVNRIVFLKGLGLSLDSVKKVLTSEESEEVLLLLLNEQEKNIAKQLSDLHSAQNKIRLIKESIAASGEIIFSNADMEQIMNNKAKWRQTKTIALITGIPLTLLEDGIIIYWIVSGNWRLCLPSILLVLAVAVVWGTLFTKRYYRLCEYICPKCKHQFRPKFKEFFFAGHTPKTRKLRCPNCDFKGYCVETVTADEEK